VTGPGSKAEVITAVSEHLWPLVAAGTVRPVIDTVVDMPDAATAHRRISVGGHVGKVVLRAPTATG
jgi:NADPH:quinone reductase-like Zn-dependent oxidoreductase